MGLVQKLVCNLIMPKKSLFIIEKIKKYLKCPALFITPHFLSAPNAYSVAAPKDSPAYSLASRSKELKKYVTPAPGNYEV